MRMFIDPKTGDPHPESYYTAKGIPLDTVIEMFPVGDGVGFDINVDNIPKMDIQAPEVFGIFADFCAHLLNSSLEADEDEAEEMQTLAGYIGKLMMEKMGNPPKVH